MPLSSGRSWDRTGAMPGCTGQFVLHMQRSVSVGLADVEALKTCPLEPHRVVLARRPAAVEDRQVDHRAGRHQTTFEQGASCAKTIGWCVAHRQVFDEPAGVGVDRPWRPPDRRHRGRSSLVPEPAGDQFEALGDPNRREILRLLSTGGKPVVEIAASMPISRPAVSRHLRLLKEAGMVADQAAGTRRIYHLREQGLAAFQHYLEGVGGRQRPVSSSSPRTRAGTLAKTRSHPTSNGTRNEHLAGRRRLPTANDRL